MKTANKIAGIIIMIISLLWFIYAAQLYYGYHFSYNLYGFMYFDNVLFFNMFLGIAGIAVGCSLLINKLKLKWALLIEVVLLIIGYFNYLSILV